MLWDGLKHAASSLCTLVGGGEEGGRPMRAHKLSKLDLRGIN